MQNYHLPTRGESLQHRIAREKSSTETLAATWQVVEHSTTTTGVLVRRLGERAG
jgi:hypothetical protein